MEIKTVEYDRAAHLPLLLEADPYEGAINEYIGRSRLYVLEEEGVMVALAAVTREDGGYELKNIAVRPGFRGRGLGSALIERVKSDYAGARLWVGTGGPVGFYQKHGFEVCGVRKNFFVDTYPEPLFDGDEQCVDMIMLELTLTTED